MFDAKVFGKLVSVVQVSKEKKGEKVHFYLEYGQFLENGEKLQEIRKVEIVEPARIWLFDEETIMFQPVGIQKV
jgi:hypothetical protein